ncbi:hypothetical protein GCM10009733_056960 [Nonomuraea maheshkhaliensis]|uniref:Class I SAM-dependent methyltransferase n=2 Tax=Nonomuraea maheshkhaliensis TaxID=419590 RepID=A0ABP4RIR7_9ACTN
MVGAAREHCAGLGNVEVVAGDLTEIAFQQCDFVVAYLTMHFLPPGLRRQVPRRICQGAASRRGLLHVRQGPGARRPARGSDHDAALPAILKYLAFEGFIAIT